MNEPTTNDPDALSLTDAGSTYNPALVVLRDKGYSLYFVPDERPAFFGDYLAIKERRVFSATDPLRLLGLVALWEHEGDDWYWHERDDVLTRIERIGFADDDFRSLDDATFAHLVAYLRPLFALLDTELPEVATRAEVAHRVRSLSHNEPST